MSMANTPTLALPDETAVDNSNLKATQLLHR
jgi:hypothetical protein